MDAHVRESSHKMLTRLRFAHDSSKLFCNAYFTQGNRYDTTIASHSMSPKHTLAVCESFLLVMTQPNINHSICYSLQIWSPRQRCIIDSPAASTMKATTSQKKACMRSLQFLAWTNPKNQSNTITNDWIGMSMFKSSNTLRNLHRFIIWLFHPSTRL